MFSDVVFVPVFQLCRKGPHLSPVPATNLADVLQLPGERSHHQRVSGRQVLPLLRRPEPSGVGVPGERSRVLPVRNEGSLCEAVPLAARGDPQRGSRNESSGNDEPHRVAVGVDSGELVHELLLLMRPLRTRGPLLPARPLSLVSFHLSLFPFPSRCFNTVQTTEQLLLLRNTTLKSRWT